MDDGGTKWDFLKKVTSQTKPTRKCPGPPGQTATSSSKRPYRRKKTMTKTDNNDKLKQLKVKDMIGKLQMTEYAKMPEYAKRDKMINEDKMTNEKNTMMNDKIELMLNNQNLFQDTPKPLIQATKSDAKGNPQNLM